ncbi:hypothetical protein PV327_007688 [Microctonus hyperodae]|uniref:Uncharacterized protein n=1 Tax=Microctonus hyperodae TaxID=165561 RepID=A0AA39KYW6_MICHY|nr:hypothetical protein PV327_007688 [Microctonus hyperodae]
MSMRLFALIIFITLSTNRCLSESLWSMSRTRRAGESVENAICEPSKRHLDLDGCGQCICTPHGYGSVCEKIYCPRVYKRPIDERECTPFEDFQTHCHFCKCSSGGIPVDCEEKSLGCMDKLVEKLKVERFRESPKLRRRALRRKLDYDE